MDYDFSKKQSVVRMSFKESRGMDLCNAWGTPCTHLVQVFMYTY